MCGRFVRKLSVDESAVLFGADPSGCDLGPSFNIAPRQPIVVVMEEGKRKLLPMRWGLIPHWAHDEKIGDKLINARAETIAEKPSFKTGFKSRRCLFVADGFYEWTDENGKKQPMYIHLKNDRPFGMAGIHETWISPDKKEVRSCAIITTEANEFMKSIHHRMPVIVDPRDYDRWLDPQCGTEEALQMLKQHPSTDMQAHRVSTAMNATRFNSPECIRPQE